MLGESDKSSFYFDYRCFSALGLFSALTFASLFLTFILLEGQVGVGEVREQ